MTISPSPTERRRTRAAEALLHVLVTGVLLLHVGRGVARSVAPPQPLETPAPLAVDLATDPLDRLVLLPGIGEVRAAAILEDRKRNGPLEDLEDLPRVRGIGPHTLKRIRETREVRAVVGDGPP